MKLYALEDVKRVNRLNYMDVFVSFNFPHFMLPFLLSEREEESKEWKLVKELSSEKGKGMGEDICHYMLSTAFAFASTFCENQLGHRPTWLPVNSE